MGQECHQPVPLQDGGGLLLPNRNRVVVENVKERIVLECRKRQLDDVSDEIRHHGAAPATLWLEMRNVGDGHVIRELERAVPLLFAVHRTRPEPVALEFPCVPVDLLCPLEECRSTVEEVPVVIQIVKVDFEATCAQRRGELTPGALPSLRNELKRGLDAEAVVEVHHRADEVVALLALDVVRHHGAGAGAVRPEPDERYPAAMSTRQK